jgi:hypothetical protein
MLDFHFLQYTKLK